MNTITSGDPITLPEGPAVDGFVFLGWYDNAEFNGNAISGSYYNGTVTTLYARYMSEADFNKGKTMDDPHITISGMTYGITIDEEGGQIYFQITVEAGERWNITTLGDGDHKLWIYDAEGNVIKTRDSSYAENYDYTFGEAGTYYVGVGYCYSDDTGSFQAVLTKL